MLQEFRQFIREHQLFSSEDQLAIAVSGGMDSMCAVHLLEQTEVPYVVLHANFKLRGSESEADAAFVVEQCSKLAHCKNVLTEVWDTKTYAEEHKVGIQEAARTLRYNWFSELHERGLFTKLILAHHKDDQLETFLINAHRVSGLKGLASIPIQRDYVVRPLMAFDRAQIKSYVEDNQIAYREDSSNQSDHYLRNAIRQHILPELEAHLPDFRSRLDKTVSNLRSDRALFEHMLQDARSSGMIPRKNGGYSIDLQWVGTYPQSAVFLYHLLDGYGFTLSQCESILNNPQSGNVVASPLAQLHADRGQLILTTERPSDRYIHVPGPGTYTLGDHTIVIASQERRDSSERVHIQEDAYPLTLRYWQEGDYILPLGMNGKRKLVSDLFVDEKIPVPDKRRIPLLCSGQEVLWLVGLRISHRIRTSEEHSANAFLSVLHDADATMT